MRQAIDRVAHHADAVGVGDHHRPFEEARLLDPGRAGHLAVAVQREPARRTTGSAIESLAARQDRGDAGAHRALADLQLALARDERRVADLDAGDVGDGVGGAGRAVERDAEIAGPRRPLREHRRRERQGERRGQGDAGDRAIVGNTHGAASLPRPACAAVHDNGGPQARRRRATAPCPETTACASPARSRAAPGPCHACRRCPCRRPRCCARRDWPGWRRAPRCSGPASSSRWRWRRSAS